MFKELYTAYDKYDQSREKSIMLGRETIKLSKKLISAVHSGSETITKYKKEIEDKIKEMKKQTVEDNVAIQEYIEAELLVEYSKTGKLLPYSKFDCKPEDYIMGLCDFAGELQRRAVIQVSKGNFEEIKNTHKTINEIYEGLLDFPLRGEARRKFDSIKYLMIRQEEIILEIRLKQK